MPPVQWSGAKLDIPLTEEGPPSVAIEHVYETQICFWAIEHLFKVTGISPIGEHVATHFTDIARVMYSDMITEPAEPLSAFDLQYKVVHMAIRGGRFADVVNIFDTLKAHHSEHTFGNSNLFSDAAKIRYLDVLLFLCENWTPSLVASWVRSPVVAQIYINFGWDINHPPRFEKVVRDKHFTRWLLDKGAVADAKAEFDITAVSSAVMRTSVPIIKLLLTRSSGIQHDQLLHFAVQRAGGLNIATQRRSNLYFVLQSAAGSSFPDQRKDGDSGEIVELLLNLGCPIDSIWFRDDQRS
ncbi:ankyrin [Curvularia clavata]|uniref:Ankyrin n=1 Tax=Curvularia clavata TaxID=95742 RepID=A0A9Q8ZE64_CURCL|nr:ankyrin [Curvularia clavata]